VGWGEVVESKGAKMLGQGARGDFYANAMRARAGRWAAHRRGGIDADTRSLSFQRRRNQEVPPPYRRGESDPEPCRPLGRQGGPASGCISCVHSAKPAAWTLKGRLIFSCNLQPARAAGRLSTQVGAKERP